MDVMGGFLPQQNGSPIFAGSHFTGPLLAGNVPHTSAAPPNTNPTEAGLGGSIGLANTGYAVMAQSAVVAQVASPGVATPIVLPAQSQILRMTLMTTTAFTATVAITQLGGGAADLVNAATVAGLGPHALAPTTAGQIGLWDNIGNQDMQIVAIATSAGAGVGTLTVEYIQGINNAS